LAFDRSGNLFASEGADIGCPLGLGRIDKLTPDGVESEFATGLNGVRGLAFDRARNLFGTDLVADEISKFTPDGDETVFASGIASPEFSCFPASPNPTAPSDSTTASDIAAALGSEAGLSLRVDG
jgi:hypothetical protein